MSGRTPEVRKVLDALRKVKSSGEGWAAACPAHKDSSPSMSVGIGKGGKILLNCHKGCTTEEIVAAAGLEMNDLFPGSEKKIQRSEITDVYDYVDADGDLVFQVLRAITPEGKKDFRQRRPDGAGGWIYTTTEIKEKPLYRLPEVREAIANKNPVWIVEGEKDVDNLRARGITATCNPGGAGKWRKNHTKALKGARVYLCPDMDGVGYQHAEFIRDSLIDVAEGVRVIAPPDGNKDVSDALEAGHKPSDFKAFDLDAAIGDHDPFKNIIHELREIARQDHIDLDGKLKRARAVLDRSEQEETLDTFGRLTRWDDFLSEKIEPYDWIIPGLLERSERVIVVAAEGVGKTMLARQVALMASAGMHPFNKGSIEPIRTLFVDLENPERIIRRTSKEILDTIKMVRMSNIGDFPAHLLSKPDGVDLLKAKDRAELEQVVAAVEPDLLLLGPLYKAYLDPGSQTSEAVAVQVARYLDYIRTTYGCALWLEHHAPLGSSDSGRVLRPFGSSVWSRWPEFGFSLNPDPTDENLFDVKHYRGMRDMRDFPRALRKGGQFPFTQVSRDAVG